MTQCGLTVAICGPAPLCYHLLCLFKKTLQTQPYKRYHLISKAQMCTQTKLHGCDLSIRTVVQWVSLRHVAVIHSLDLRSSALF